MTRRRPPHSALNSRRSISLQCVAFAAIVLTVCVGSVAGEVGDAPRDHLRPIAGGPDHAWFTLPVQPGGPTTAVTLYHIPAEAEPGVARLVRTLPQSPVDIASMGDSAVLVYASQPGRPRPVRQLTASRLRPQWYVYTDPVPLPPLPGDGSFLGFVGHESGPVALMRSDEPRRAVLLRLVRQQWQALAPPLGLDSDTTWTLVALGPAIAIIEQRVVSEPTTLWVGSPDSDGAVAWERRSVEIPASDEIFAADAQLISMSRSREGVLEVKLHRGDHPLTIASFKDVPSSAVAVPVGDRITFAWEPPTPSLRLMTRVVTLSGLVLHDGWAPLNNPVSSGELQVLAAGLGSLILTVLVFLLKPDRGASVLTLPKGASLAEPSRRLLATAIDLVPGLLLASAIWDNPEAPTQFADVGVLPLAVVAGVTILHASLAEAIFGRTLGKTVLGCRTVTLHGERPRWSQALGRNLAKTLCPGLVVFVIANPFVPHPGSFGTVVILDSDDEDDPGAAPDGSGDGRPPRGPMNGNPPAND